MYIYRYIYSELNEGRKALRFLVEQAYQVRPSLAPSLLMISLPLRNTHPSPQTAAGPQRLTPGLTEALPG